MIINVGSKNQTKVDAVKECIAGYPIFDGATIVSSPVSSGVSEQPKSLGETISGAKKRAKNAFSGCDYSVGLESGLMKVPYTKTGYMDVVACAIYDGNEFHIGLSSAFEYPLEMTRLVLEEGLEIDQAAYRTKLTDNPDVGSAEGAIGILTKGRLARKEYTKQAIITALIHIENPELYKP